MKVLVIPDVHLKPWMFERPSERSACQNSERTGKYHSGGVRR